MKTLVLSFALWTLMAAAAPVDAAGVVPTQVSKIVSQQQKIRSEVEAGSGPYRAMPAEKKSELLARQQSLLTMLEGKQTLDELEEGDRVAALDTLKWIDSMSAADDGDRTVCERRQILGSNRKERVCMSAAALKAKRERDQERLQNTGGDLTR